VPPAKSATQLETRPVNLSSKWIAVLKLKSDNRGHPESIAMCMDWNSSAIYVSGFHFHSNGFRVDPAVGTNIKSPLETDLKFDWLSVRNWPYATGVGYFLTPSQSWIVVPGPHTSASIEFTRATEDASL